MHPLSAPSVAPAASSFISIGIQVCDGILEYYSAFKDARTDIKRMYSSIERLGAALEQVSSVLTSTVTSTISKMGAEVKRNIQGLQVGLKTLEKELDRIKVTRDKGSGIWGAIKATGRRHTELESSQNIGNITSSLTATRLDSHTEATHRWLNAYDTSLSYNAARELRYQNTGQWLLKSWDYNSWKSNSGSRIWLYRKAGCRKTIISSTVIEDVLATSRQIINCAVAFLYFRYNHKAIDARITQYSQMLRSFIVQLSCQSQVPAHKLDELYEQQNLQPSNTDLENLIVELVPIFDRVFIVLDALDECDGTQSLLKFLTDILGNAKGCLHLLVTSRREIKIEESLHEYRQIHLEENFIADDIRSFIADQLAGSDFQQFPPSLKLEIENDLTRKASGRFQWVICETDTLRKYKNASVTRIRSVVASLPTTLDATYERILSNVDEDHRRDISRLLEFLAFKHPWPSTSVEELSEVICLNLDDPDNIKFNRDRKPLNKCWVLEVCSALVQTERHGLSFTFPGNFQGTVSHEKNSLSHFSVKEFLTYERLRENAKVSIFYLDAKIAHKRIGLCCEIYASLVKDEFGKLEDTEMIGMDDGARTFLLDVNYPELSFYHYASRYVAEHLDKAKPLVP